jgi:ABC-2 type transport system permease protein
VRRLATLLWLHVVRQVLSWSGSWWFILALAAGQVLPPLIGLAVWRAVFPDSGQVSTYYVALLFTVATTASYENHTFSQGIYIGTLSDQLVRPTPVVLSPLGENIALRVWITLFSLPVVVLVAVATEVRIRPADLMSAVPLWLGAGVLRFLLTWCLAMAAFWSERVHAITAFGTTLTYLLGGNAVPLAFLPAGWSETLRYLPFYSMVGLPADAAAGLSPARAVAGMAVQWGWILATGLLSMLLWRRGLNRYTSVGA